MSENETRNSVNKPFKIKLMQRLRDPIWQFIGVVLTFFVFLIPVLYYYFTANSTVSEDFENSAKIQIAPANVKILTNFPSNFSSRSKLVIDGREEKDVHLLTYYFQYKGKKPIKQEDFVVPIRGILSEDRKLIGIQKSETPVYSVYLPIEKRSLFNITPLESFDSDKTKQTRPYKPIDVEVVINNQKNFEIKCPLINPNEWFSLEIYTSASDQDVKSTNHSNIEDKSEESLTNSTEKLIKEISWNCRIAAVQCPTDFDLIDLEKPLFGAKTPDALNFSIIYTGWAVYYIVIFNSFSLLLFFILVSENKKLKVSKLKRLLLFLIIAITCLTVSEITADIAFNGNIWNQPLFSLIMVLMYLCLLISLLNSFLRDYFNK